MSRRAPERGPTVRQHLLILALAALLPVWGLAGHIAGRMAEAERGHLSAEARETAQELAFAVERQALSLRAELTALAAHPALRQGDYATLHALAAALPLEHGTRLRLSAADGGLIFDTALPYPPPPGAAAVAAPPPGA
ncbi:hypothetical protein, partial [Teichococcus cervicalis]